MRLGVYRHRERLVQIGVGVDINMADAIQMLNHWHPRL